MLVVLLVAASLMSCGGDSPTVPTTPTPTPASVTLTLTLLAPAAAAQVSTPPFPVIRYETCWQENWAAAPSPALDATISSVLVTLTSANGEFVERGFGGPGLIAAGTTIPVMRCTQTDINANDEANTMANQLQVAGSGSGTPTANATVPIPADLQKNLRLGVACTPDATTLCLQANRFRVFANWALVEGPFTNGMATVVDRDADEGSFSFNVAGSEQLFVEVIDACGAADHFQVSYRGTTNLTLNLFVIDTVTGQQREYRYNTGNNIDPSAPPLGEMIDTSAFATCSSAPVPD
jgi:hypothetical protein